MPTEKQQWLDKYDTYYAATEYNRRRYGKRIKQLQHMLEDENFLGFLSDKNCKEDILEYLAKSECCSFDMYIAYSEQGEPYIHDHDFGLINHMKKMLRILQSEKSLHILIFKSGYHFKTEVHRSFAVFSVLLIT